MHLRLWPPEPAERSPPRDADSADSPHWPSTVRLPLECTRPRYRLSAVAAAARPAAGQDEPGGGFQLRVPPLRASVAPHQARPNSIPVPGTRMAPNEQQPQFYCGVAQCIFLFLDLTGCIGFHSRNFFTIVLNSSLHSRCTICPAFGAMNNCD